jgi:hypothetical protein
MRKLAARIVVTMVALGVASAPAIGNGARDAQELADEWSRSFVDPVLTAPVVVEDTVLVTTAFPTAQPLAR